MEKKKKKQDIPLLLEQEERRSWKASEASWMRGKKWNLFSWLSTFEMMLGMMLGIPIWKVRKRGMREETTRSRWRGRRKLLKPQTESSNLLTEDCVSRIYWLHFDFLVSKWSSFSSSLNLIVLILRRKLLLWNGSSLDELSFLLPYFDLESCFHCWSTATTTSRQQSPFFPRSFQFVVHFLSLSQDELFFQAIPSSVASQNPSEKTTTGQLCVCIFHVSISML